MLGVTKHERLSYFDEWTGLWRAIDFSIHALTRCPADHPSHVAVVIGRTVRSSISLALNGQRNTHAATDARSARALSESRRMIS